jgi:hypothetical protein
VLRLDASEKAITAMASSGERRAALLSAQCSAYRTLLAKYEVVPGISRGVNGGGAGVDGDGDGDGDVFGETNADLAEFEKLSAEQRVVDLKHEVRLLVETNTEIAEFSAAKDAVIHHLKSRLGRWCE